MTSLQRRWGALPRGKAGRVDRPRPEAGGDRDLLAVGEVQPVLVRGPALGPADLPLVGPRCVAGVEDQLVGMPMAGQSRVLSR
jgi:hypothetical protein